MTQNSINNNASSFTIDPGASGDSFVQFDINATGEFRIGVDDDADDSFKISQGSALGTNDTFVMSAAGELTMPLQPAFNAYQDASITNATGNGTQYQFGSTALTERFDQNGDFNVNGTFTAPVSGKYNFGSHASTSATSSTTNEQRVTTSNRTYKTSFFRTASAASFGNVQNVTTELDASDTCVMSIGTFGDGADTATVFGNSSFSIAYVYGSLLC